MVRADELYNEVMAEATAKGASQGMFIGCSVDTSTGSVSFTCEGKDTSIKFKMEPETKLFPAIFVEATSKEILQIELGRSATSLPLSAAVLPTSDKHVIPQFPPRLKVQCLKPHQWARGGRVGLSHIRENKHYALLEKLWLSLIDSFLRRILLFALKAATNVLDSEMITLFVILDLIVFNWLQVPNQALQVHALKLSDIRGWSMLCEDAVSMLALHIPALETIEHMFERYISEEDRCIDILELIEMDKLLSFHSHTLTLYAALCYQSNYRAAHALCQHVDQKQLLYAIQSQYMSGPLRQGFYDLLIALHLESHATTMEVCKNEYVIPLGPELKALYEDPEMGHSLRSLQTESVRPQMKMTDIAENISDISNLYSPYFPLEVVREFVMQALAEAVETNQVHNRDPVGGSNENLFLPLIKLTDRLLLVGMMRDEDVEKLLIMSNPETWDPTFDKDGKDEHRKGLLHMKMAEGAKLQMCYLLQHLNDIQLRHRVEAIISFAHDFVGDLQTDQLRRYVEIKASDLPSAVAAKKTREFRCPPREQMNAILSFKHMAEDEEADNFPCGEDLIQRMNEFHESLMARVSLAALQEPETDDSQKYCFVTIIYGNGNISFLRIIIQVVGSFNYKTKSYERLEEFYLLNMLYIYHLTSCCCIKHASFQENAEPETKKGAFSKLYNIINTVKELEEEPKGYLISSDYRNLFFVVYSQAIEEPPKKTPEEKFRKVLIQTIVSWAEESQIETPKLVREMFSLLVRQYDAVGELIRALEKTYVINAKTKQDVAEMWVGLSQIRALLPVQMSQEEEELMRKRLW
ncbi:SPRY domain-containing protein [Phthorimaea operculella]|nr:SPRY domain-containing protein [Phthorimaea operculella]